MKTCTICLETKELEHFHKLSTAKDGYRNQCKECRNARNKTYKRKATQYNTTYAKTYYRNNSEVLKQKSKESYARHSINRKSQKKIYRDNNKDKIALGNKKYYNTTAGKLSRAASTNKWRASKLSTSDNTITKATLQDLLANQDSLCKYCSCSLDSTMHLDHVIPLSKGGCHTLSNVVFSCRTCNTSKGAKLL